MWYLFCVKSGLLVQQCITFYKLIINFKQNNYQNLLDPFLAVLLKIRQVVVVLELIMHKRMVVDVIEMMYQNFSSK